MRTHDRNDVESRSLTSQTLNPSAQGEWLRMASKKTRSSQETYMMKEEEEIKIRRRVIFPAKTENNRPSRVCVFTDPHAKALRWRPARHPPHQFNLVFYLMPLNLSVTT